MENNTGKEGDLGSEKKVMFGEEKTDTENWKYRSI
jgi:hypothetical protein